MFVQFMLSIVFNLLEKMLRSHILIENVYYLALFWDVIGYMVRAHFPHSCAMYGFAQSLTAGDGGVWSMHMQAILDSPFARMG